MSLEEIKNGEKDSQMNSSKYLEFSLGEEEFAIPLMMVREVITIPETTEIPNVPSYFLGIMNLRGIVVSIIDLRSKLSIKSKEKDLEEAVIILNIEHITIGIVVDSINKVLDFHDSEIKEIPEVDTQVNSNSVLGIYQKPEGLTIILDIITALDLNKLLKITETA